MREVVFGLVRIAVGLAWVAIWTGLLHELGVMPYTRKAEGSTSRREHLSV
jgi:hypothetical protein